MIDVKTESTTRPWLMLAMKLPTDAASARVRIWRRLNGLGAVSIKNGFYALPNSAECREDFEWLRREIEDAGGEALTLEANLMTGMSDEDMCAAFDAARNDEYEQLIESATELDRKATVDSTQLERLRRQYRRIKAVDFFSSAGGTRADVVLSSLEAKAGGRSDTAAVPPSKGIPAGRIWVTRSDPRVDRLASAWFIRRFADRNATFRFTSDPNFSPSDRVVRYDMFEAEYTHRGNRCTFEVLLEESGIADPALVAVAQVIHDIDIKDDKYGRDETPGIARMIDGLTRRFADDQERLERAMQVFDDFYASLADQNAEPVGR